MAAVSTLIAVGVGVAAAGTVVSTVASLKAQKRQRRLQRLQTRRERVAQVRESRIRAAQVQQAGVNTGAGLDSSAVVGGTQNVATQARSNISFINQVERIQNSIANAQGLAQLAAGITSVVGAGVSLAQSGAFGGKGISGGAVPTGRAGGGAPA